MSQSARKARSESCSGLRLALALLFGGAGTSCGPAGGPGGAPATSTAPGSAGAIEATALPAPPAAPPIEVALVWSVAGSSRLYLCSTGPGPGACRPASAEEKDPPAGDASLAWSPDGARVVFGTADLLRFVDGTTGTPWKVAPGRRASYAPDGSRIVVVDRAGVQLLDAGLAHRVLLARSSAPAAVPEDVAHYDGIFGWSADGQRVAVSVGYYEGSGVEVLAVPGGTSLSETPQWAAAWAAVSPDRLFTAAFDKVAGYADDGLWEIDLAALAAPSAGKKDKPAATARRLGEAGEGLLLVPGDTLVMGYAEAGSFTRAPPEWRPRGILAVRLAPPAKKKAAPEIAYRRIVTTAVRAVPLGLSTDGRMLLYGAGGAAGLFDAIRWADLATGETGDVPRPPGPGRVLAAALRPDAKLVALRGAAAVDASWARGAALEVREGELWLAGAPPPESVPIVKPLPIPWPASYPTSLPAGTGTGAPGAGGPGTGAPAGTGSGTGAPAPAGTAAEPHEGAAPGPGAPPG